MTLPSTESRPTIDLNNIYAMASTSLNDSLVEYQPNFNETQSTAQLAHNNNNNNNNNNNVSNNNTDNNNTIQRLNPAITSSLPATATGTTTQTTTTLPIATASSTIYTSHDLAVESVMPGIYFTKNFIAWNEENLRAHGFTHIIIIDKHIQELYYPSPVFKLSTLTKNNELYELASPFDYFCSTPIPPARSLNFSKEFEAIDLNFGEKSYLTTVLPNCYRAVRFINKALQSGGTILVIDCNGGEQKCLTIIVAYLMYKYNISFSNAFARLKSHYKKADLDRFYISQLYEYEPILQVQRSQSRGHSCSRELHAAILKRKKPDDDVSISESAEFLLDASTSKTEFLQTINPLSQFNTAMAQQQHEQVSKQQMTSEYLRFNAIIGEKSETIAKNENLNNFNHPTWDDFPME